MKFNRREVKEEEKAAVIAYAEAHKELFSYPQPIKGTYDIALGDEANHNFWYYKLWIKQMEVAEKGSGLEEYFANQNLTMELPEGFSVKSTVSMAAGSDIMAVDCICPDNTKHLFDDIKDFYFDADITTANLESCIYDKAPYGRNQPEYKDAPRMNSSEEMLDRIIDGGKGINYVSMANNHCYDYGIEGLMASLDAVEKKGLLHSGTNRSKEEQEKALVVEKNGIQIAMLSCTADMNGHEYKEKYAINEVRLNDEEVDLSLIDKQLESAEEQGADITILHAHWGWEYELYPHTNIVSIAHTLAQKGIDVIVGTHPHCAEPSEVYEYEKDGEKKKCLIIYSLGDFVSFHPLTKDSKLTYIVKFNITKGELNGRTHTYVNDFKILPLYILMAADENNEYDCRLLKFKHVLEDKKDQNGNYKYSLTKEEREDVPRLKEILYNILLPKNYENVKVD